MPTISIIVAVDLQNAIGRNNDLLCHLPADLKYFKTITEGHSIIMGRKTFESLPKGALPNRRNIVITQNEALHWPHVETCHSLEESIALTESEDEIFIIGGGSVYQEAMDIAGKLYVTKIHHQFKNADTFFPAIENEKWKLVSEEDHEADAKNKYDYSFLVYERAISQYIK